jgi:hypothetical protein
MEAQVISLNDITFSPSVVNWVTVDDKGTPDTSDDVNLDHNININNNN